MGETAKREGQVTVWLKHLDKAMMELDAITDRLEERLATVLETDYPKDVGETNPDTPLVGVAHSIRVQVERLQSQQARLSSIVNRIEL